MSIAAKKHQSDNYEESHFSDSELDGFEEFGEFFDDECGYDEMPKEERQL